MKCRVLVAAVVCCALTFGSYAQTPLPPPTAAVEQVATASFSAPSISETPSPTPTLASSVTVAPPDIEIIADVLFPAGIAFQLIFREPETDITSITMAAEQQGWEGQSVDIDPADVTTDESGFSTVRYLWTVDENPPLLFEPLTITWAITPRDGDSETIETELVFAESRITWTLIETAGIPVRFAAADSRTTAVAARAQLTSLAELLEAGGRQIPPLNVVLFPLGVNTDPCAGSDILVGPQTTIEAPCNPKTAAALYAAQGWELAEVKNASALRTLISEIIARAVYPSLFTAEDVPDWFKVGLIHYLAGTFNVNDLETARSASRNNSLLPSLDIEPSNAVAERWRLQSIGMIVYMASRIGVVPMLELLDRVDDGELLSEAWLDKSGQDMNALNTAWRNWIFSPYAEAAFSVPPSLAPTPTLVPTRTASFTPTPTSTLTPTSTWTNTLVPSITPTLTPSLASGFERPTAVPTVTPTPTLQPTITPRPPVAFILDDPADTPPAPLDRALTIAAIAAVLVIVLSAAFLIFTRRPK